MKRATDLCTCGKTREEHGTYDVEQHTFFPNPQPVRPDPPTVEDRIIDLLESLGNVHATVAEGGYLLTQDSGEIWEVRVLKRSV